MYKSCKLTTKNKEFNNNIHSKNCIPVNYFIFLYSSYL